MNATFAKKLVMGCLLLALSPLGQGHLRFNYFEGMVWLAERLVQREGVVNDQVAAWKRYRQAATKNDTSSINIITIAYINGGYGLTVGERKSATVLEWIRKAEDGGLLAGRRDDDQGLS